MNTAASPSDLDRDIALLELVLHVQRLIDDDRLPRPIGEAVVRCMSAQAGLPELDA